ncbi:hypothetical protein PHMEG_0006268 [Phytophthora megakarya]|uniref:Uncharacterized protein n=1 Tax=Phytophthora megakarya TaxID=4795 RepID=A0A225WPB1_9STRA|nr:hypothetical protein PHMEG_0006268 [Phytophthora megakarya]
MPRLKKLELERCRQRRQQWLKKFLPRVLAAKRPNSVYLRNAEVLNLLQHISDGMNELLMARPLSPLPWLADFLQHACKLGYGVQNSVSENLILEMHKKRRVIQSALRDTKQTQEESKRLIHKIIDVEQELKLVGRERRLKRVDHAFLAWEEPSVQSNWSIDTSKLRQPVEFKPEPNSSVGLISTSPQLFKTNIELTLKLDEIKVAQHKMRSRLQTMQNTFSELEQELAMRNRFIVKLSESHVTTRTQAIMDGTPVFLDSQKHWVLPEHLLNPRTLSSAELQGLRRAECFLMERDENHWKFLIRAQLEYDSATLIQTIWRGQRAFRAFQRLLRQRRRAATLIQRNYFRYLYTRAISLPRWCRPGREVIVAPSIAQKCAISFQFYPKKDFPAGNYRREPKNTGINELMEMARQDEMCAAFTTDGAFKRFLPRMLSQLKPMLSSQRDSSEEGNDDPDKLTDEDGLYVKIFPKKDERPINSAIVVEVPEDRFGLVRVVLDGIAITELVPVTKLSDRWKRIRVKRLKSNQRRKTRAIVFGKGTPSILTDGIDDSPIVEPGTPDTTYERIESDDEDVEESLEKEYRRQRRLLRRRQLHESGFDQDDDPDYIFEDLATGRIMRHGHPHNTYEDPTVRARVIATRKKEYNDMKPVQVEAKKFACAVKIQCAWRSKRAREHFRQMLVLRGKEREREHLVDQIGAANAHKRKPKRIKKTKSGGQSLFSRFRRN